MFKYLLDFVGSRLFPSLSVCPTSVFACERVPGIYNNFSFLLFFLFDRYGRVQSVKILLSSCHPNLLLSSPPLDGGQTPTSTHHHRNHHHHHDTFDELSNFGIVSLASSAFNCNNSSSSTGSNTSVNTLCLSSNNNVIGDVVSSASVSATVAFIDIKSASKAHNADHNFDDRILTTEYYEPSTIIPINCDEGVLNCSTTDIPASQLLSAFCSKSAPSVPLQPIHCTVEVGALGGGSVAAPTIMGSSPTAVFSPPSHLSTPLYG